MLLAAEDAGSTRGSRSPSPSCSRTLTAGTFVIRGSDFGFLQSWFGPPPKRAGEYAGSRSQRLIYAYIGGRIFLDHPALGVGWYPTLPPAEYARYLPDARSRFSDQPPWYFPPASGLFVP